MVDVWSGILSSDTTDGGNWSDTSPPTSTDYAEVNSAAVNDPVGNIDSLQMDFADFAGTYDGTLNAYGDVILSAAMTWVYANSRMELFDGGGGALITNAGIPVKDVRVHAGHDVQIQDNAVWESLVVDNTALQFNFNTFSLTVNILAGDEDGAYFEGGDLTWASGAALVYHVAATGYGDLQNDTTDTTPPMTFDGGGWLYPFSADLPFQSLAVDGQNTGGMYFDTVTHFSTVADLLFVDAMLTTDEITDDMNGCVVDVGGNFSADNTALSNGVINVTGTAVAINGGGKTIANMDFSGGSNLDATDGYVDGGGNVNVTFGAPSGDTSKGATAAGAGAGF